MANSRKLSIQLVKYCLIAGIGWFLDFGIFTLLTEFTAIPVALCNYMSSIPAYTFGFFMNVKKTFETNDEGLSLKLKYFIFILYAICLISVMSFSTQQLAIILCRSLVSSSVIGKLLAKLVVTPISIICNFTFLKVLAERW